MHLRGINLPPRTQPPIILTLPLLGIIVLIKRTQRRQRYTLGLGLIIELIAGACRADGDALVLSLGVELVVGAGVGDVGAGVLRGGVDLGGQADRLALQGGGVVTRVPLALFALVEGGVVEWGRVRA